MSDTDPARRAPRPHVSVARFSVGGRAVPDEVVDMIRARMRQGAFDLEAIVAVARSGLEEHLLPRTAGQTLAARVLDAERKRRLITKVAVDPVTKRASWTWDEPRAAYPHAPTGHDLE